MADVSSLQLASYLQKASLKRREVSCNHVFSPTHAASCTHVLCRAAGQLGTEHRRLCRPSRGLALTNNAVCGSQVAALTQLNNASQVRPLVLFHRLPRVSHITAPVYSFNYGVGVNVL
jgi:hypothetical protein